MKKFLIPAVLVLIVSTASQFVEIADAAPNEVVLSYSFVGCSGNEATYDLSATMVNGGTFTWGWGV